MTAADRLAEIEARFEAATEGPWTVLPDSADWDVPILDAAGSFLCCSPWRGVRGGHLAQDAAFIAHARTDLPATVKALRAVLALHKAETRPTSSHYYCAPDECDQGGEGELRPWCPECSCWAPCMTARAISEALGGAS